MWRLAEINVSGIPNSDYMQSQLQGLRKAATEALCSMQRDKTIAGLVEGQQIRAGEGAFNNMNAFIFCRQPFLIFPKLDGVWLACAP